MTIAEWYVTLYALGTGVTIGLYWTVGQRFGTLPQPVAGRAQHVAAELVTAAALVAAGIARLVGGMSWEPALTGLGLGLAVYAIVGSAGLYREPWMRTVFVAAAVFTVPAVVAFLVAQ